MRQVFLCFLLRSIHARNDDRLQSQGIKAGQLLQLIDGVFEERPGVRIANEKPSILNIDVLVENGLGRGVHVGDESVGEAEKQHEKRQNFCANSVVGAAVEVLLSNANQSVRSPFWRSSWCTSKR